MSIYGFNVQPISRLDGGSVAKSAAYILRANIRDPYLGETHYCNHLNGLVYSEILVPDYAPDDFHDRDVLLSSIDQAERRYDARTETRAVQERHATAPGPRSCKRCNFQLPTCCPSLR